MKNFLDVYRRNSSFILSGFLCGWKLISNRIFFFFFWEDSNRYINVLRIWSYKRSQTLPKWLISFSEYKEELNILLKLGSLSATKVHTRFCLVLIAARMWIVFYLGNLGVLTNHWWYFNGTIGSLPLKTWPLIRHLFGFRSTIFQ